MRKNYPYLSENYLMYSQENQNRKNFLSLLDDFANQKQYVKMTLLDWEENPLKEIEGEIISGNISKDGASPVRRTCSLNCSVNAESYNVDLLSMDYSLNKKIFIEIGIENQTKEFLEYPILWFPQGVFYINEFSMNSSSTSAVNISLSLKDKICLLNGDIAGQLPSMVRFDVMDTQLPTGEVVSQKVLIYEIIKELLVHYGKEKLSNLIIEDIPLRIKEIVQWTGQNPLYARIIADSQSNEPSYFYTTDKPKTGQYETYRFGEDVGYIESDFVITKELIGNAGNSVCTILDSIKQILGNYEYFYDEMGFFHFREIKNYLNTSYSQDILDTISDITYIKTKRGPFLLDENSEKQYLIETTNNKTVYNFTYDKNITSITVTPQYKNIKNDYIVEGLSKDANTGLAKIVHYHLAIDDKPEAQIVDKKKCYGKYENLVFYTDKEDNLNKLSFFQDTSQLPDVGEFNTIYHTKENNTDNFFYWSAEEKIFKNLTYIDLEEQDVSKQEKSAILYPVYYALDWRTKFYLDGLKAQQKDSGIETNRYFEELKAFWPMEYDLRENKQKFFKEQSDTSERNKALTQGNFFLDLIDPNFSSLGEYNIKNIGVRSDIIYDQEINCLFDPFIPNVLFLNVDNPLDNESQNTAITSILDPTDLKKKIEKQRQKCSEEGQPFTQVNQGIYSNLATGGYSNCAFEKIKYELFCHTNYQKTVSITAIPVFYLEPNTRVELKDKITNTFGNFMVQNINLTLGPGANMSVVLNEITDRT